MPVSVLNDEKLRYPADSYNKVIIVGLYSTIAWLIQNAGSSLESMLPTDGADLWTDEELNESIAIVLKRFMGHTNMIPRILREESH